jgi:hypothetical protein
LHQQGYTVRKTIDCLTATFCLQANHELLHLDYDFDGFEKRLGLKGACVISEQRLKRELLSSAA